MYYHKLKWYLMDTVANEIILDEVAQDTVSELYWTLQDYKETND